eukprot:4823288-Amphidinium_carterae.1
MYDQGRWTHALVPLEVGGRTLHIFNLYGYDESYEEHGELNRAVLQELLPHVFSLKEHPYVVGGDWNFEPDDFPIDLARGDTLVRPPSDKSVIISCYLAVWRDSVSAEMRFDWKPDHSAVQITLAGSWVKQTFLKRVTGAPQEHDNPVDHWRDAFDYQDRVIWNKAATTSLAVAEHDRGILNKDPDVIRDLSRRYDLEQAWFQAQEAAIDMAHWPTAAGPFVSTQKAQLECLEQVRLEASRAKQKAAKDSSIQTEGSWAASPGAVARGELHAWSKLLKVRQADREVPEVNPAPFHMPEQASLGSLWDTLSHIEKAKAVGADQWIAKELRSLGKAAIDALEAFFLLCEQQGQWPEVLQDLLYLQLPKDGAKEAGQRRPIAALPYYQWCTASVRLGRSLAYWTGEKAFTLAHEAERATLEGVPFPAVFLDCSKCYERVDLSLLEELAHAAGFPLTALRLAIDMYRGRRRILVNGAIQASELRVSVRKYVDDMVLSASGQGCAYDLREAFRAIKRVLEASGMRLNKTKCVVVANTNACCIECRKAWHRMGVDVSFTTRDLGVDVQ